MPASPDDSLIGRAVLSLLDLYRILRHFYVSFSLSSFLSSTKLLALDTYVSAKVSRAPCHAHECRREGPGRKTGGGVRKGSRVYSFYN